MAAHKNPTVKKGDKIILIKSRNGYEGSDDASVRTSSIAEILKELKSSDLL